MKKSLTILAVLAMAVCISSTVATASNNTKAAKPEKAAKAPKSQPVVSPAAPAPLAAPAVAPAAAPAASVFATLTDTTLTLNGVNLVPGTKYAYTYEVWTIGNPYSYFRGGNDGTAVKADGTYSVTMDIADLKDWAGIVGLEKVVMWFRPATSTADVVSVNADGAPLRVEQVFGV